jgi:cholesterol transport system auxiliary component
MVGSEMRKYVQIAPKLNLLAALFMLSACASAPPATYELFSPTRIGVLKPTESSLVVAEPKSSRALDTERMIVREADGAISYVPGAQWADRVPVLLQTSMIKAIEAKGYSVSREGGGVLADHLLTGEITAFNLVPGTPAKVELALTMRLIDAREGRLIASQAFYADSEIDSFAGSEVVSGFDKVLSTLMPTIAQWALARH